MKMKREIMAIARAMGGIMEDKRSYLCYWARVSSQITDHRSQITDHRSTGRKSFANKCLAHCNGEHLSKYSQCLRSLMIWQAARSTTGSL